MIRSTNTVNAISSIFCEATKEVLESSTGKEINFSNTIQKIPVIHLRPEIGCFVLFSGDYSGLMIMNFSADAAVAVYRSYMCHMGMPEEELANEYTSDEVVDNVGELINQIIGKVRKGIEVQYGLVASNTQPKAIALTTSIILTIDAQEVDKELCRRLSFKIDGHSFHIELSLEKTEFVALNGGDVHKAKADTGQKNASVDANFDQFKENLQNGKEEEKSKPAEADSDTLDFDALLKANK